jgi:VIT1/CCC1 family predicted Fe2+/Mn2+ transporter
VTQTSKTKGILETLLLGALAAAVSYFVGDILEQLIH